MITVYAYKWVPPFAQGLVRDLRVRWALEEAGLPYQVRLIGPEDQPTAEYRALQPFGQVPAIENDGLKLFESGAILLHLGERSEALLPRDEEGRARATAWVLAALNSIEICITPLAEIDLFHAGESWAKERRDPILKRLRRRLGELSVALGDRDYLEGTFTAGDLMMAAVLRILRHTDIVAEYPNLRAFLDRCEARPAFQRALQGQMSDFSEPVAS